MKTEDECNPCRFEFDLKDETVSNRLFFYEVQNNAIEGKIDEGE